MLFEVVDNRQLKLVLVIINFFLLIALTLLELPQLLLPGVWQRQGTDEQATEFDLASSGSYHFKRCERRH